MELIGISDWEKRTENPREDLNEDPWTEDPNEDHATEDCIKNYYNRILLCKIN